MNILKCLFAALILAAPAHLAAQVWEKTDELPGGIPLEVDRTSMKVAADGERTVVQGTFRKPLPMGMMETSVSADCAAQEATIRRVRLLDGAAILADNTNLIGSYSAVHAGTSEAFYFNVLCGTQVEADTATP